MSGDKPRPFTIEEMETLFLKKLADMRDYWMNLPDKTLKERMDGLIFSMLVIFDGEDGELPAIDLKPSAHPSDKSYHQERGENWWRNNLNIAGNLHNRWGRDGF